MPTPLFNRVYDREYFSGSQATIYIGDVFVDEITSFNYSVQHTKTPVYGYASELFDGVSKGPILVTGSFSINFKESGYLYLILMRYKQLNDKLEQALGQVAAEKFRKAIKPVQEGNKVPSPFVKEGQGKDLDGISRFSIERILRGETSTEERFAFYNSLAGFASSVGQDTSFEDIVEVFEDRVWGTDQRELDNVIRRSDDSAFDGFDMYLVLGDFNNRGVNHTVRRLSNVHIIGSSLGYSISGEPIQEEYNFFSRNAF